jgi:hypothetical protein
MQGNHPKFLSRSMAAVSDAVKPVGLHGRGDLIRALKELGPDANPVDLPMQVSGYVAHRCG